MVVAPGSACVAALGVVPTGGGEAGAELGRPARPAAPCPRARPRPPPPTWTAQGSWRRNDPHRARRARRRWWRRRRGRRPTAIEASGVPALRTEPSTVPSSRRTQGVNAGSSCQSELRMSGSPDVAGDGGGERRQGDRLAVDGADRRADATARRVGGDGRPVVAGVGADAAPQRLVGAPGGQLGRPLPASSRSPAATRPRPRWWRRTGSSRFAVRSASSIAGYGWMVTQIGRGSSSSSTPSASSVAPASCTVIRTSGYAACSAEHTAPSSVMHTRSPAAVGGGGRRARGVGRPGIIVVVEHVAPEHEGADDEGDGDEHRQGSLEQHVSPAAPAPPGATPRARGRGRRRRGRTGRCRSCRR